MSSLRFSIKFILTLSVCVNVVVRAINSLIWAFCALFFCFNTAIWAWKTFRKSLRFCWCSWNINHINELLRRFSKRYFHHVCITRFSLLAVSIDLMASVTSCLMLLSMPLVFDRIDGWMDSIVDDEAELSRVWGMSSISSRATWEMI